MLEQRTNNPTSEEQKWVTRYLFIPRDVYYNWVEPIMEGQMKIIGPELIINFYNEDKDGINCKMSGYGDKVLSFYNSLLILYNLEK